MAGYLASVSVKVAAVVIQHGEMPALMSGRLHAGSTVWMLHIRLRQKRTVICGHYHASYGHSRYEESCSEYGDDVDFSPYYGPGVIAIDASVARSKKLNVIIIED